MGIDYESYYREKSCVGFLKHLPIYCKKRVDYGTLRDGAYYILLDEQNLLYHNGMCEGEIDKEGCVEWFRKPFVFSPQSRRKDTNAGVSGKTEEWNDEKSKKIEEVDDFEGISCDFGALLDSICRETTEMLNRIME